MKAEIETRACPRCGGSGHIEVNVTAENFASKFRAVVLTVAGLFCLYLMIHVYIRTHRTDVFGLLITGVLLVFGILCIKDAWWKR